MSWVQCLEFKALASGEHQGFALQSNKPTINVNINVSVILITIVAITKIFLCLLFSLSSLFCPFKEAVVVRRPRMHNSDEY